MKMSGKKLTTLLGTTVLAMSTLVGCSSTTIETAVAGTTVPVTTAETAAEASTMAGETKDQVITGAENAPFTDLSGATSMMGSISMEKFASVLNESFVEKYPNMTVTVEFIGSGTGTGAISNGTADIGNSSGNLKDEEKTGGVAKNIVVIDEAVVTVDRANTVEDLTEQQLPDIYEEKITNWKDAGGNDAPIVVTRRESGSGTRSAFKELLKLEDMCKYNNKLGSTGAAMTKVASTLGVIGYASLDIPDGMVRTVEPEGAEPMEENIKAGSYFLSRPFVMATRGDIGKRSELVKALFDYTYSDEGAEIVKFVGLIVVDK